MTAVVYVVVVDSPVDSPVVAVVVVVVVVVVAQQRSAYVAHCIGSSPMLKKEFFLSQRLLLITPQVWGIAADGNGERLATVGGDRKLVLWRNFEDDSK